MDFAGLKVDHIDTVVAEFGDEQSPPNTINRHMIDATPEVFEWDCSLEDQMRIRRCRADRTHDQVDRGGEPEGHAGGAHRTGPSCS
ncbi:MAG: hypothetical protein E5W83_04105 [Mesorhizobium sp.]|nr:MAG: hypothetical protein E5W83_04105 [Mesorhizobium sp.]